VETKVYELPSIFCRYATKNETNSTGKCKPTVFKARYMNDKMKLHCS